MAVDTRGHLLAVHVTPANEQERAQVLELCDAVQAVTGHGRAGLGRRSFAWAARFRRPSKDYERLPDVLRGLHFLVLTILMLPKAIPLLMAAGSS